MAKKKIFLIIGRTSSGKSEITRGACRELGLTQVTSFTTRPMRDSEKNSDKCDHYFIAPAEVDKYRDQMAAYTQIGDYEYFTTYEELDNSDCYVIDPIGVKNLIANCGNQYDFVTIYISRPKEDMIRSYNDRDLQGDSFHTRYLAEDDEFTAYEKADSWDYRIENIGDLNEAINNLKSIIIKEKHT